MSRRYIEGNAVLVHDLGETLPYARIKIVIWRTRQGLYTEAFRNDKKVAYAPSKVRDLDIGYWLRGGVVEFRRKSDRRQLF